MSPAEFLLTFALGGISLRAIVGFLKEKTGAKGILALLLTLVVCCVASAIYILVGPVFGLAVVGWDMFLYLACEVFVGSQIWYRVTT